MSNTIGTEFRRRLSRLLRQPVCQAFMACSVAYALIWFAGITHEYWSPLAQERITQMHVISTMLITLGAAIAFGISTGYVAARDAWLENESDWE